MEIFHKLKKQLKYYFENTPLNETKTRYHCHLESVVFTIYRYLTSNIID